MAASATALIASELATMLKSQRYDVYHLPFMSEDFYAIWDEVLQFVFRLFGISVG